MVEQIDAVDQDVPAGFKMTELGPLPEDWEVVALGEVTQKTSQTDPRRRPDWRFRYVDVSSVSNDNLRIEGFAEYLGREAPSRARKLVASDDIIFATIRPALKRIAPVRENLDGQICSTAFCVIRPNPAAADSGFVFSAVSTDDFVDRVAEHQHGSSYPAVTDGNVLREKIPLPPLPEQRAIAHVLRTVQQAKEATEAVIAATRELKKSLMRHLFTYGPVPVDQADQVPLKETEIGMVPEDWEVVGLETVCAKPAYGYTASATDKPIGPKFLRITDIQDGQVAWGMVPYCNCPSEDADKLRLRQGDVLIARIGATTGKSFMVTDCPPAVFASYLIRLRANARLLPPYLSQFTKSEIYWKQINATKGGRLKQGVNGPVLNGLIIPLPSLGFQEDFARILAAADDKIQAMEQRRAALEALFKSLLQELMTGRMRVSNSLGVRANLIEENAGGWPAPIGRNA